MCEWDVYHQENKEGAVTQVPMSQIQPTACFINKVLLEHNHAHLFKYCLRLLLNQNSRVLATETIWAAKPKIFTICLFTDKVCWALAKGISHCRYFTYFYFFTVPTVCFCGVYLLKEFKSQIWIKTPNSYFNSLFSISWTAFDNKHNTV